MKKALVSIIILAILGGGGYAYYRYTQKPPEPEVLTGNISRGNIVDTVGSTGQLSAVRTVPVGSQVGGKILALYADFNSIVHEGQLLAEIDPETIKTQILNAKANVIRSETDVERAKVTLADAQKKYERSKELSAKNLVPKTDMDAAELALSSAQSGVKQSEASLQQSAATLQTNELNLTYTKIYSPIDGVVISRQVDIGQTVSVSQQAPTIFNLATELTTMKVLAGIDETDVGRIRPNQHATFRVDAYPSETFTGTVEQVRLEARMNQNVVTYQTVISVPNPELKLKPGMTANINIEIQRRNDVLRIPNAALRFRPTNDMYTALGLEPPPDQGRGRGGRGGPGGRGPGGGGPGGAGAPGTPGAPGAPAGGDNSTRSGGPAAPGGSAPAAVGQQASAAPTGAGRQSAPELRPSDSGNRGSGGQGQGGPGGGQGGRGGNNSQNMTPEERAARGGGQGGRGGNNFQNMTPEERERMMAARGGGRGGDGRGGNNNGGRGGNRNANGGNGGRGGPGGGNGRGGQPDLASARAAQAGAPPTPIDNSRRGFGGPETIDLLFPALPSVESRGRAWTWNKEKKELKSLNLRLGVADGTVTELIEGDLKEGDLVVSNIIIPQSVRPTGNQQNNPFFQGGGRGPGGPGGGGQGGGGNRGGGGGGGGNPGGGGGGGGRGGF